MSSLFSVGGNAQQRAIPYVVNAIVTDNNDPQGQARIRVSFPHLQGNANSTWVRVCTPMGGVKSGFYALPEVGEEVLVAFLRGSPEDGIVLGAMWNGDHEPPEEASSPPSPGDADVSGTKISTASFTGGKTGITDNNRRMWRSRSGHLILFDDSDGAESVQIWDRDRNLALVLDTASNRLILSNATGDLHLRAGGKIFLEAVKNVEMRTGADYKLQSVGATETKADTTTKMEATGGMTLKSDGDVTVDGKNITATAQAKFEAGGATAKLAGTVKAEVSGGSTAVIRGGVVAIN